MIVQILIALALFFYVIPAVVIFFTNIFIKKVTELGDSFNKPSNE